MANPIQIKRTSVSGRAANTSTLTNPGELAINMTDGIMYSTNGSVVFEVGANLSSLAISGTPAINSSGYWVGPSLYAQQEDYIYSITTSTSVITGADDNSDVLSYTAGLESVFINGVRQIAGVDYATTNATAITLTDPVVNNDVVQVINFEGSIEATNVDAQFTWTNTHTFSNTVTINDKLGIGTASPLGLLEVANITEAASEDTQVWFTTRGTGSGSDVILNLVCENTTTGETFINFGDSAATDAGQLRYNHDGDSMEFRTATSERMRIDSSGNLLVGTTTATNPLGWGSVVQVGGANPAVSLINTSSNKWDISNYGNDLTIWYNSSEALRIKNNGNVGIGTSSPSNPLDIEASTATVDINMTNTANRAEINLQESGTTKGILQYRGSTNGTLPGTMRIGTQGSDDLIFNTAGAERMRVLGTGNVGIGLTSPSTKLHVDGDIRAENGRFLATRGTAAAPAYRFHDDGDTGMFNLATDILGFATGGSERMRITSGGALAVGTTSPLTNAQTHFQKNVNADFTSTLTAASSPMQLVLRDISNTTTYPDCYSGLFFGAGATGAHWQYIVGARNNGLVFGTGTGSAPVQRMVIDTSGNVGIGTSSPLVVSGYNTLSINGASGGALALYVNGTVAGSIAAFSNDIYYDSVDATIWRNGAAFNGTPTERMRMDSSGNVGIGTSSPANTNGGLDASGALIARGGIAAHQTSAGAFDFSGNDLRIRSYGATAGTGSIVFRTGGGGGSTDTERGRISGDGQWRWGDTATIDTVSYLPFQVTNGISINTTSTAPQSAMSFFNGQGSGTRVGWIGTNGSATSYNTSSDQRLKENIADADDAGSLLDAIRVRKFDWKLNGEHQAYGMVAQELDPVYPDAVSHGPTEDDMMAVDYSKLVPMLVKEIQSLRARVAQLEGNT